VRALCFLPCVSTVEMKAWHSAGCVGRPRTSNTNRQGALARSQMLLRSRALQAVTQGCYEDMLWNNLNDSRQLCACQSRSSCPGALPLAPSPSPLARMSLKQQRFAGRVSQQHATHSIHTHNVSSPRRGRTQCRRAHPDTAATPIHVRRSSEPLGAAAARSSSGAYSNSSAIFCSALSGSLK
jgi:hypothetical protein